MTADTVDQIVRGLTKASKRALPLIDEDWTRGGWGGSLPNPNDAYSLVWGRNRNLRLVDVRLEDGTGVPGQEARWEYRLTPLGLEVRTALSHPLDTEAG